MVFPNHSSRCSDGQNAARGVLEEAWGRVVWRVVVAAICVRVGKMQQEWRRRGEDCVACSKCSKGGCGGGLSENAAIGVLAGKI